MTSLTRYTASTLAGTGTTLSLLLLMDTLSAPPENLILNERPRPPLIPNIEEPLPPPGVQVLVVPKPPKPKPKPEPITIQDPETDLWTPSPPPAPPAPPLPNRHNLSPGNIDGDAIVLVAVQPHYPRRCADKSFEGVVDLMFDLDATGAVINARILSEPGICGFGRAALKAISKFRFKPKVIEGRSEGSTNLRYRFTFSLTE